MSVVPTQSHGTSTGTGDPASLDRMLPRNREAELSVLGSMAMSKDISAECQDIISDGDYYWPIHGTIHSTILDLQARGLPSDPIQLTEELHNRGELTRIGGPSYLHGLLQAVDSPAMAPHHAKIIRKHAILRRLIEAGIKITQLGYNAEGDVDELVAAAAAELARVVEGVRVDDDFLTPEETLEHTLDMIDDAKNGKGLSGLSTGFADLDSLTGGLQPAQLVIVAARPAMGKSTFAMDLVRACSVKHDIPAAFISLEMGIDELNMRLLSAEAKVGLHKIRNGTVTDEDWTSMARAVPKISQAPIHINESAQTLHQIQAKIRRLKAKNPRLGLVVIDYLQLITLGGRRTDNRQQEVAEISRSLKLLAKELQVPIVALSQLNRGPEQRTDKRPVVSDLRESGSIEQDADIVCLLHRDDAYEKESPRAGEVDLIIGKHRNGPTATITVANQLHYSRFVDMAVTA
ncbi:replicative DNA helicase [Streptomyces omiyaensis]|uniref:replicative DNA helicase n=1 Tax=Streptomyces omiyaensis TaxID=68247 RepID=UPI00167BAE9A|nr:replicative DNA helicase [Streptomyces omiyaensis]GGY71070.1 replicative DNA helicase [Streptomyces omiyaensis]